MKTYTTESCYAAIEKFFKKKGRAPAISEMRSSNGLPAFATFQRITGKTPLQYLKEQHPDVKRGYQTGKRKTKKRKSPDKARVKSIIAGYQAFLDENGRMPRGKEVAENHLAAVPTFKKATGMSPAAYFKSIAPQTEPVTSEHKGDDSAAKQPDFLSELMARLSLTVNDIAIRTGLSAARINELMKREPSQDVCDLCNIARAMNIPMEVLFRR